MIYDNHGRPITYLRLAVTDRCNLRCFYCMPAEGIQYMPKKELLTYEEMLRMVNLMASMGINKVRITGGEPFVRKDLMYFLRQLRQIKGIQDINITTNGVLTTEHVPELKQLGISSVNLSLDTFDRDRFKEITRRDEFDKVKACFDQLNAHRIPTKINAVVMEGKNTEDIIPLAELSRNHLVSVRFIEEMPFNGEGSHYPVLVWTHHKILQKLKERYSDIQKIKDAAHSTSYNYHIPGHKGEVGIIAAFSRTFCGSCNRVRVTAQGTLKTCLYDDGVLDIRQLLRSGVADEEVKNAMKNAFRQRPKDGFEAESLRKFSNPASESMSTIGG
ncbi:GTP 3',8-cyclase MoaA [Catalinimonas niigatensis]|uniref:GTP 3',8-cyclase MoaA n=1 Tax=Catalinimonas niigatensis TaxID=1397264 RepID=UPI0026651E75|nr:GTP 3',8-cyclase MoaA [Catalinimonas niigatensis]WPP53654.1 GTP 3',8-cyclase MoaA [Catalinimonas niigatensis]